MEYIKAGYKLTFPESWRGWYIVVEEMDGLIAIRFYGKSISGSTMYAENGMAGVHMFYIASETELPHHTFDDIEEIGEINGEKYYYCSPTGVTFAELSAVSEMGYYGYLEDIDEAERAQEIELVNKDWEKYQEMAWTDKNVVLSSFCAVE